MRTFRTLGIIAGACALLGASGAATAQSREVKLGYILPLSGGAAEYGQRQLKGATLAIEEVNQRASQNGFTIRVITSDTKCIPLEASNAAERLIEQDRIDVMMGGTCSPEAIAALRVSRRASVPHVVTAAAATSITEDGNPYVFRVIPHTRQIGENLGDVLADKIKVKRVATVFLNDDFGIDLNGATSARLKQRGVQVLTEEAIERTTMDFFALVAKLKTMNPDVVVAPLFNRPAAQLVRTLREQGMSTPLADTIMFTEEYHQLAGAAADGTVQTVFFHHTTKNAQGRAFVERYKAKYPNELPGNFEAEGYDAVHVLADALARSGAKGGVNKEALAKALRETKNFRGVMGPISFDAKGQVIPDPQKFTIIRNTKGKIEVMD